MRILACYEEILKEKKCSLSRHSPVIDFCKSFLETRASPPVLLDVVNGDPGDWPTVLEEISPP